jgi:hypothetical protein
MIAGIENALRGRICPTCVRYTSSGGCSLPKDRPCSLFENLEKVVDIVTRTHCERIDPYIDVLRDEVCAACHFEDDHGSCPCRNNLDCALDTYYPLIVEVVEDHLAKHGR